MTSSTATMIMTIRMSITTRPPTAVPAATGTMSVPAGAGVLVVDGIGAV